MEEIPGKKSDQTREVKDEDEAVPSTSHPPDGCGSAETSTEEKTLDKKEVQLCEMMEKTLNLGEKKPVRKLDDLTLQSIAKYMQSDECKNIIVMVGAGISTAAGIPDFRSPDTGIYFSLEKYKLPSPSSMFDIQYFKCNPEPFYQFAKEMFPSQFKPTICHYFLKILNDKGKLLRLYTQNIDTLERVAGVPASKLVEAHGSFYTSHCMNLRCHKEYDLDWLKEKILQGEVPTCEACFHFIKPDIIFFGEELPRRFHSLVRKDFPICDLLIVIGTSLTVHPFAGIVDMVGKDVPRILINNRKCDQASSFARLLGLADGFDFDSPSNTRDVFWEGTADAGCMSLAHFLGWEQELVILFAEEHTKLNQEYGLEDGYD